MLSMHLSQLKSDIEALDHEEKARHLEKTNFKPTDKSHIDFMKKKFKKRWSTANTKLSITRQSSKNVEDETNEDSGEILSNTPEDYATSEEKKNSL